MGIAKCVAQLFNSIVDIIHVHQHLFVKTDHYKTFLDIVVSPIKF